MNERDTQSEFERRAKEAFDRSAAELDAATRSRLTQARYRALEELQPQGSPQRSGWSLAPVGVLATVALAAWLVLWQAPPVVDAGLDATPLADLEILLGEEDLEMLDEELEFYAWLEDQPEFAAPAASDGVG
jgi:hypothetical protein